MDVATTEPKSDITDPCLGVVSCDAEFELGTFYYDAVGGKWRYVKMSYGSCEIGEFCHYQWVPWNRLACFRLSTARTNTGQVRTRTWLRR